METCLDKLTNANHLIRYLLRIGANLEKICNRVIADYGLTQQQLNVLNEVRRNHGITRNQIISMLGYEKSNLSKIVAKLEKLKYLTHTSGEKNKRVLLIHITTKGNEVWEKCIKALNRENAKIFGETSPEEMHKFKDTTFQIFKTILGEN